MAESLPITLHAMASEALAGSSDPVDIGERRSAASLSLTVALGANAGLEVSVESAPEESGPWSVAAKFPLINSAGPTGRAKLCVASLQQWVRVSWELETATTFSVGGEAHTLYATPADVTSVGIPADAIEDISESDLVAACITASCESDAYIRTGYVLPLTSWDGALRIHCARIALYNAMSFRGFQPEGPDQVVQDNWKEAIKWMRAVGEGKATPDIVDSTPEVHEFGGFVISG